MKLQKRKGSVIVVVLVLITLASLLLARFMEDNSLELSMSMHEVDRQRLRVDAMSEMELALGVINEIRAVDLNKIHAPSQGFVDPHAYIGIPPREGLEVSFDYEDESSKLPLSSLDKNGLIQLLYALGTEQRDAERISDALIAWTNKKYESIEEEATDVAYQRAKLSFKPARRPLRSFEELRTIGVVKDFFFDELGNETPLLTSFKECVSLYTFGDTNINTASDALLYAQGLDERQVGLIREKQSNMKRNITGSPPYFRVTREVRTLIGGNAPLKGFDDEIHLMWIHVTVKEGLAKCRVNALVSIRDDVTFAGPVDDPSAVTAMDAKSTTGARTFSTNTKSSSAADGTATNNSSGTSTSNSGSTLSRRTNSVTPGVILGTASSVSLGGRTTAASLNYPFRILAWSEDNGPPPSTTK
jgi:general secretion pathway protein K